MTSCSVTSFKKAILEIPGRFCADSNSEKSNPLFLSRRPSKASGRSSVNNIRPNDVALPFGLSSVSICPDVMVTRPDALQSSRRIHRLSASVRTTWQYRPDTSQSLRRIRFSFADTDMGRQLRLSGRQVYTIRTPSLIRQDVGKNCNHPDVRVTLFER